MRRTRHELPFAIFRDGQFGSAIDIALRMVGRVAFADVGDLAQSVVDMAGGLVTGSREEREVVIGSGQVGIARGPGDCSVGCGGACF